jgi:DNA-binding NarL/FixJ family response regulator
MFKEEGDMGVQIILVDDHRIMRSGLRGLIENCACMEVIGEAQNGREAVRLVQELSPDVVIMDIEMPDLNGIEATRQIIAASPDIKVIVLSMHSDRQIIAEMLRVGAKGYLLKDSEPDEIIQAIRTVVVNRTYLCPEITDIVAKDYVDHLLTSKYPVSSVLTPRECEVLQLLAEGKTTKQIASHLYISVNTVESHRRQIMDKLNIHNIAELTKYAIRHKLTPLAT